MTRKELDTLWFQAMRQSIEGGEDFVRYHFAALVAAAEREKVAAWMRSKSYATGHGDTTEDLLKELEWQVAEREREACAKVAENTYDRQIVWYPKGHYIDPNSLGDINKAVAEDCAAAIRARGEA